jgi:hypothetical protein
MAKVEWKIFSLFHREHFTRCQFLITTHNQQHRSRVPKLVRASFTSVRSEAGLPWARAFTGRVEHIISFSYTRQKETGSAMAETGKVSTTIDTLESELDNLINNDRFFGTIPEDYRKLVHKVFFVHAMLEHELAMRILYKLFEEQLLALKNTEYCLTETMVELTRKLTYTERLTMVKGFKDGAPHSVLEKINSIRNDFGHPIERRWKDKYGSNASRMEVLQLLIVGIKSMNNYMAKVREKSGI